MRRKKLGIETQSLFQIGNGGLDLLRFEQAVADKEIQVGGIGFGVEELLEFGKHGFASWL